MDKKHYEVYEVDVNSDGLEVWQATWDKGREIIIYKGTKSDGIVNVTRMQSIDIVKGKHQLTVREFLALVDEFISETVSFEKKYK
jgi:hypothetical protein